MTLSRMAAALGLLLTLATTAQACDSYADDMALASVLARAVAEARAQGALPRLATATPEPAVPAPGEPASGSPEPERTGAAARAFVAGLSSSP
ncbi:MAG TPA: hypothetical protein VFR00_05285 [Hyphomicrobiaceae bacterium]|jgi:hypothetical protein|nr:hypothetical protein [Hyphomicrobiaceae bacterium]